MIRFLGFSKSHRSETGKIELRANVDQMANTFTTGKNCSGQSTANVVIDTVTGFYRYLTPSELELIQGLPKDHTIVGISGPSSDSNRFARIGNSVSSTVAKHLIENIFSTFKNNGTVNILSLFSGCGGFEAKLSDNFKVKAYSEIDKNALDILRYHHPDAYDVGDVKNILNIDWPLEIDLITAGFPCQSFSRQGKRLKEEDPRGLLMYSVVDACVKFKPKVLVSENVLGFLESYSMGNYLDSLEKQLGDEYYIDFKVLKMSDYGVPQNRERVFIYAIRKDLKFNDLGESIIKNSNYENFKGSYEHETINKLKLKKPFDLPLSKHDSIPVALMLEDHKCDLYTDYIGYLIRENLGELRKKETFFIKKVISKYFDPDADLPTEEAA